MYRCVLSICFVGATALLPSSISAVARAHRARLMSRPFAWCVHLCSAISLVLRLSLSSFITVAKFFSFSDSEMELACVCAALSPERAASSALSAGRRPTLPGAPVAQWRALRSRVWCLSPTRTRTRTRAAPVVAPAAPLLAGAHARGQHASVRRGARVLRARGRRPSARPDGRSAVRVRRAVRPGVARAAGVHSVLVVAPRPSIINAVYYQYLSSCFYELCVFLATQCLFSGSFVAIAASL